MKRGGSVCLQSEIQPAGERQKLWIYSFLKDSQTLTSVTPDVLGGISHRELLGPVLSLPKRWKVHLLKYCT